MPLLFFLALTFSQLRQGYYLQPMDLIVCRGHSTCLHEEAHMRDHENGDISNSFDFQVAAQGLRIKYEMCEECRDEYYPLVRDFPGIGAEYEPTTNPLVISFWLKERGIYDEFYATMYAAAQGDINRLPETLRPFYRDFKALGYESALQEQ
jgi:hypothetical protein